MSEPLAPGVEWRSRAPQLNNPDDKPTETIKVPPTLPGTSGPRDPSSEPEPSNCLVVIYTTEALLLSKRYVLEHHVTNVGRGTSNHIVLVGDSISRRHARFERRADVWLVVDLGSTNGTRCNDEPVTREVALKSGDRIKIGPTIFKFLSGADIEAQYHEEIYRMTILDGLTQIYNKRYLSKALDREIGQSRLHERDLSILVFDVDRLRRINDTHGPLAGDFVLAELARVVRAELQGARVFARSGGDSFSILLPATSLDGAVALAEELRRKVSGHSFVFRTDAIRVTVSLGVALLERSDLGAAELLKRASEYVDFAKKTGRNRVVSSPIRQTGDDVERPPYRSLHPLLDAGALFAKAAQARPPGHLIAFEIGDEAAVAMQLESTLTGVEDEATSATQPGSSLTGGWFGDLVSAVDRAIGRDDLMAVLRERYVVAALHGVSQAEAAGIVAAITARWIARLPAEVRRVAQRGLRSAVLTSDELVQYGQRARDMLVERLLPRRVVASTPDDELPFLIAAPKAAISTHRTPYRRVKATLDALGAALRFIVAVELSVLRDSDDHERKRRAADLIAEVPIDGQPLSLSDWGDLLWRLADLIVEEPVGPAQSILASLRTAGPLHTIFFKPLLQAVVLSEKLARATVVADDAHSDDEVWLRDLLDGLLAGLRPLMLLRLVSVSEIESLHDGDDGLAFTYGLYLHRGAVDQFPIVHEKIVDRLVKRWCYLLSEDGAQRPLLLSPMVFSGTCAACQRVEAYLAEGLTFGPLGSRVNARSVTTNHSGVAELPQNQRTRQLDELVEAALGERKRTSAPVNPPSDSKARRGDPPSRREPESGNPDRSVDIQRISISVLSPAPPLLRPDQLREVESAARNIGLAMERVALLATLPTSVTLNLPFASSPGSQLSSDLAHLNRIAEETDGSIPLRQWLVTACTLREGYREVDVFEHAIRLLDAAPPSVGPLTERRSR